MKGFIAAFAGTFLFLLGLPVTSFAATTLTVANSTTKWAYPYVASDSKAKHLTDGIKILSKDQRGTPVSTFVEVLGPPDQIDDLHKDFEGMSVAEDGMLSKYRQYLSYRLVWYVKKRSATAHALSDVWFSAYVGNGGDGVVKVVSNKIEEPHH